MDVPPLLHLYRRVLQNVKEGREKERKKEREGN